MHPYMSYVQDASERFSTNKQRREAVVRRLRAERPRLIGALLKDARAYAANRGEPLPDGSRLTQARDAVRLVFESDDYLGAALYRVRTALQARGIPVVPWILRKICIAAFGIRIGDTAVLDAGVYIPHGNVVVDGLVHVGAGSVLCPWVTLGVNRGSVLGPALGERVFVGTGARLLGGITVGDDAVIGAGAVVVHDVASGATVAGVPARVIGGSGCGEG